MAIIELPCKTSGCPGKVRLNDEKGPLPGLLMLPLESNIEVDQRKEKTVYLTCDNPEVAHTNRYIINK